VVPQPDDVRRVVLRVFRECGAPTAEPSQLKETVFAEGGRCLARSYRAAGLMAMWMVNESLLQFYDAQGNMLRTLSFLPEADVSQRRMAA